MGKREEFYYDSRDMQTKIHAVKWVSEQEKPKAILQICHGMTEHILRYDEFAQAMCERGYLVTGNDHLGHGLSRREEEPYGYFCRRDAATVVIRDVHRLKKIIQEQNPGVPYFLLGHSMGSFIARGYLARYGTGIDGAVIVGTGNQPMALLRFAKAFVRLQMLFCGGRHPGGTVDKMAFGTYNKRWEPRRTDHDWLSRDTGNVDRYEADPMCGFTFTLNGFETLFSLAENAARQSVIDAVPKELPVLFLAGADDPVGDYGRAVREVYDKFVAHGMQHVSIKLYEGARHEILNETEREQVYDEVTAFLGKYSSGSE